MFFEKLKKKNKSKKNQFLPKEIKARLSTIDASGIPKVKCPEKLFR